MTVPLNDVMDQINDLTENFWKHFGVSPVPYDICDMRGCSWVQRGREFGWWEYEAQLQNEKTTSGSDDPGDWDPMYTGDVYGTSVWTTSEFTVAVLDNGCGDRDAYLFDNKNRIQRT